MSSRITLTISWIKPGTRQPLLNSLPRRVFRVPTADNMARGLRIVPVSNAFRAAEVSRMAARPIAQPLSGAPGPTASFGGAPALSGPDGVDAADRRVDELDGMEHRNPFGQVPAYLQEAS